MGRFKKGQGAEDCQRSSTDRGIAYQEAPQDPGASADENDQESRKPVQTAAKGPKLQILEQKEQSQEYEAFIRPDSRQ